MTKCKTKLWLFHGGWDDAVFLDTLDCTYDRCVAKAKKLYPHQYEEYATSWCSSYKFSSVKVSIRIPEEKN